MAKKKAKKKVQRRTEYLVNVSYKGSIYFDYSIDNADGPEKVIPRFLKKQSGGSGLGFGRRDMSFYFRSKKDADAVKGKIAKAPFKKKWGVRVDGVYQV